MFVDLSELGLNLNDLEYNEDKLNSQIIYMEEDLLVENYINLSE